MIKRLFLTGLLFCSLIENCFAVTELDFMEYSSSALAQAAYVSSDALSAETVDQQNISTNTSTNIGGVAGGQYCHSQSFQLSVYAQMVAVEGKQVSTVGSPTENWHFELGADDGAGKPSATVLSNVDIAAPGDGNVGKGSFATPFYLSPGVTYHMVLKADSQTDGNYWNIAGHNDGSYANGNECYSDDGGTTWATRTTWDLYFKIYVKYPILQSFSESIIKTQGSYSLKGIAAVTDSLNDTLTRTVSPTIDLTGQTQIKFDIYSSRTGSNIKIGIRDSGLTTTETTPNITSANAWQTVTWDISGVSNADKDAIDRIIITIVNADASNTFYTDNMYTEAVRRIIFVQ